MKAVKIKSSRRYYLHRKIKGVYRVEARKRLIHVPVGGGDLMKEVLNELINGGYSAQYYIK
ncbi:MAG: hypothetical protein V1775_18230 [Bacteroidota bacterium]